MADNDVETSEELDRQLRIMDRFASPQVDADLACRVKQAVLSELRYRRRRGIIIKVFAPLAAAAAAIALWFAIGSVLVRPEGPSYAKNGAEVVTVQQTSESFDEALDELTEEIEGFGNLTGYPYEEESLLDAVDRELEDLAWELST